MIINYGIATNNIDVTEVCHLKLKQDNIITIPWGDDNRCFYFTDPLFGILKSIFIESNGRVTEYDSHYSLKINCDTHEVTCEPDDFVKLLKIHSSLKLRYGSLYDEFPEQKMAMKYLKGTEKVLEIGGNIGRNSCVIGRILNHSDFVSMECDPIIAEQLIENRDMNGLTFHVENAALSKRKLIQKGWDTIPSDVLLDNYKWVPTITLEELNEKYKIPFDTLVLDCEGAFYYILLDMPELLDNIKLIIMENDYYVYSHKLEVDAILCERGFKVDYEEPGGWGPSASHFFEVWKR
jgi:FkbM family methyltransferase